MLVHLDPDAFAVDFLGAARHLQDYNEKLEKRKYSVV